MMASTCGICHEKESKYKCPICELRYCSLSCYKSHKPTHDTAVHEAEVVQASNTVRDRPGTTQRIPKADFAGFENDPDFQRLLVRYPLLKVQLQAIYALTLEPGPDEARTWHRQPLPGSAPPNFQNRGGRGRGRGRGGRGDFGRRGARNASRTEAPERERGPWTQAKGDKEAMGVIKTMRGSGSEKEKNDLEEGMREFVTLCRIRFGEDPKTK